LRAQKQRAFLHPRKHGSARAQAHGRARAGARTHASPPARPHARTPARPHARTPARPHTHTHTRTHTHTHTHAHARTQARKHAHQPAYAQSGTPPPAWWRIGDCGCPTGSNAMLESEGHGAGLFANAESKSDESSASKRSAHQHPSRPLADLDALGSRALSPLAVRPFLQENAHGVRLGAPIRACNIRRLVRRASSRACALGTHSLRVRYTPRMRTGKTL